jgi:hypothetical protein|tara:strand:+ start:6141 stop:6395 length:255 start_codon:yes stop_codon:yes gene_type:complete
MIEKETLMLLSSQIKERRNEITEDMARGTADLAGYQHACGQIRGFDTVQVMIADLLVVHNKEEEDFESTPTDSVVKMDTKRRNK